MSVVADSPMHASHSTLVSFKNNKIDKQKHNEKLCKWRYTNKKENRVGLKKIHYGVAMTLDLLLGK